MLIFSSFHFLKSPRVIVHGFLDDSGFLDDNEEEDEDEEDEVQPPSDDGTDVCTVVLQRARELDTKKVRGHLGYAQNVM